MYKSEVQLKQGATDIIAEQLRAAEMRQGCTNYTYYAEILLRQLEPIIWKYAPLSGRLRGTMNWEDALILKARQEEIDEAEQRGVKKVVDWMKLHKAYLCFDESDPAEIKNLNKAWQAFLKECGK